MMSKRTLLLSLLLGIVYLLPAQALLNITVKEVGTENQTSLDYNSLRFPKPIIDGQLQLQANQVQTFSLNVTFTFDDANVSLRANRFAPSLSVSKSIQGGTVARINADHQLIINSNPSFTNFRDTLMIRMIHPSLRKPLVFPVPVQSGIYIEQDLAEVPVGYGDVSKKSGPVATDYLTIEANFKPTSEQAEIVLQKFGNRYLMQQNQYPRLKLGEDHDLTFDYQFKDGSGAEWKMLSHSKAIDRKITLESPATQQLDTVYFAFHNKKNGKLLQAGITCIWMDPDNGYVPRTAQVSSRLEQFLVVVFDLDTGTSLFEGSLEEAHQSIIDVQGHQHLAIELIPDEGSLNQMVERRLNLSADMEWANRDLSWEDKRKWKQMIDFTKQPQVDQVEYLNISIKENGVLRTTPILFKVLP